MLFKARPKLIGMHQSVWDQLGRKISLRS